MLNWIVLNRTDYIKMDLALNNQQTLIYHKSQQPKPIKSIRKTKRNLNFFHFKVLYFKIKDVIFGGSNDPISIKKNEFLPNRKIVHIF